MNSPVMVNTQGNKVWFYQEKLKNYVTVSSDGTDQIFPYNKRLCLCSRMACSVANSLSVNPGLEYAVNPGMLT